MNMRIGWGARPLRALVRRRRAGARAGRAPGPPPAAGDEQVQLDFNDVELSVVIDTIARLTGKNFIYDDRVRGRVTIVSPTRITVEEAYAVFESVLQVKGFTTVQGPGGAIKVIPLREAKESNVETVRGEAAPPASDRFITRLIPLRYIDAEAIAETLKPLVSKDASLVAYAPTNTVILTDAATNISRILSIVRAIDVETFKEELSVMELRHADATTMAQQLSEIFGADVADAAAGAQRLPARARRPQQAGVQPSGAELASKGQVRIITDQRTNSLIVLASRQRTAEIRDVVARLDVEVKGGGRIHVYYLKYADAEELANTISALLSGQPAAPTGLPGRQGSTLGGGIAQTVAGNTAQGLRASIVELAEGVTVTADPPTNSLLIQASQEGYNTLSQVIAQLDIPRPQVLVEALIMEVDVTDSLDLGFSGLVRITSAGNQYVIGSLTDTVLTSDDDGHRPRRRRRGRRARQPARGHRRQSQQLPRRRSHRDRQHADPGPDPRQRLGERHQHPVRAAHPHARQRGGGDQGRRQHPDHLEPRAVGGRHHHARRRRGHDSSLATSQNIERQDIGITLRVTPQISEGDTLRLEIFQEVTAVNEGLTETTGSAQEVGVALSNRRIENVVTVSDEDTVVVGGLIDELQEDTVSKVPWLGDIPILGWLFKTTGDSVRKRNLLVFLTPHIIRNKAEHARESIRKREEFWAASEEDSQLTDEERVARQQRIEEDEAAGIDLSSRAREGPGQREPRQPAPPLSAGDDARHRERVAARPSGADGAASGAPGGPALGGAGGHLRRRGRGGGRAPAADRSRARRHAGERGARGYAALRGSPRPLRFAG